MYPCKPYFNKNALLLFLSVYPEEKAAQILTPAQGTFLTHTCYYDKIVEYKL